MFKSFNHQLIQRVLQFVLLGISVILIPVPYFLNNQNSNTGNRNGNYYFDYGSLFITFAVFISCGPSIIISIVGISSTYFEKVALIAIVRFLKKYDSNFFFSKKACCPCLYWDFDSCWNDVFIRFFYWIFNIYGRNFKSSIGFDLFCCC